MEHELVLTALASMLLCLPVCPYIHLFLFVILFSHYTSTLPTSPFSPLFPLSKGHVPDFILLLSGFKAVSHLLGS